MFKKHAQAPRLLVVPGLNDSGPVHWQTWLSSLHRDAVRVVQDDWLEPDLDRWAARVAHTLEQHGGGDNWLVAAHSFGCLALARHLKLRPDLPVAAALLVAPADPRKFGVLDLLPTRRLPCPSVLVGSQTDPWMSAAQAKEWADRWGSHWVNLGDAGHINAEAGFGPWPYAQRWVVANQQRWASQQRPVRAAFSEWTFAV
ncbi:MAG: alpha/beta hydrolase [Rhizobacter sp.]